MQKLVEGGASLSSFNILLYYVELFTRKDVASQKSTFKNSRHWNFQVGFFPYSVQAVQFLFGL